MVKRVDFSIFCENVKWLRHTNGLSKRKMSSLLGISAKTLTSIENGAYPTRLSLKVIANIDDHFGIAPHQMVYIPLKEMMSNKNP